MKKPTCYRAGQAIAVMPVQTRRARSHPARETTAPAGLAWLKARINDWQAHVESETFDVDGVRIQLPLPESRVDEARARIIEISRGRSEARRLD